MEMAPNSVRGALAIPPELEAVLDRHIRPLLHAHGGDMEVMEITGDGTLRFRLLGQCAGCPAADLTTEELIQAELTRRFPQIRRAVLVHEVSTDMLEQARSILQNHRI